MSVHSQTYHYPAPLKEPSTYIKMCYNILNPVFCDVVLCTFTAGYQHLGGTHKLQLPLEDDGSTFL